MKRSGVRPTLQQRRKIRSNSAYVGVSTKSRDSDSGQSPLMLCDPVELAPARAPPELDDAWAC